MSRGLEERERNSEAFADKLTTYDANKESLGEISCDERNVLGVGEKVAE